MPVTNLGIIQFNISNINIEIEGVIFIKVPTKCITKTYFNALMVYSSIKIVKLLQ